MHAHNIESDKYEKAFLLIKQKGTKSWMKGVINHYLFLLAEITCTISNKNSERSYYNRHYYIFIHIFIMVTL